MAPTRTLRPVRGQAPLLLAPIGYGPGTAEWPVWTSTARIVVTDPAQLAAAETLVRNLLARVDRAASRFRADSEVSRIAAEHRSDVRVSPLLAEFVAVALQAAETTDGALDPTMGSALAALGYDRDLADVDVDVDVDSAQASGVVTVVRPTTWHDVQLDGLRLRLPSGTLLDLGATAKAHAADRAAETVARRLGVGVLVSLGGDLRVDGPEPDGGWSVLVQDGNDQPHCTIRLTGARAVATSSTLHRTWRQRGERLHHVLNPATRRPAQAVWRTATVAADTCLRANTVSTACLVRGHDAPDLLRRAGVAARLVAVDGTVHLFGGWPA